MPSCSIKNCKNNTRNAKNRNITFLGFPRKTEMIEKWKIFCKENINPTSARVCLEHFLPGQIQDKTWLKNLVGDSGRVSKKLLPDAVPMASIVDHSVNTESRTDDTQRNVTGTDHGTNRDQPCESNFVQLVAVASNDENLSYSMTVRTSTCTKNGRIDCTSMQAKSAACNSVLSNTVTPSTSRSTRKSKKEGQCVAQESDAMLLLKEENRKLKKALVASVSETKLLKRRLATINKRQKKQLQQNVAKKVKNMLSPFFTPAQIRMYMNPKQQKTRWSQEDIAAAISFKSVSPKAYRYIRKLKQIPLPAPSTLRKWITDFNINEGILTDVLSIMKAKSSSMTPMERATVICFDEIYLTNQMQIERKTERVVGPHKRCQVLIARGIFKKWKQPVYYGFDQDVTKDLLIDVITQLHASGYTVFAMTSDLGNANQKLWKSLNVGHDEHHKTYFMHPCEASVKIYVFADVPHLVKLVCNHFLDSGFHIDGHHLTSAALSRLLQINSGELKIAFKLSETHLNVTGPQRQNVKLATQLFSATNAAAIEWCGSRGIMDACLEWEKTAAFVRMVNDWFDVFNSVEKYGAHPGIHGYGVDLSQQNEVLRKMTSTIEEMRVGKWKTLVPFQKGIIISNSSLVNLFNDLKERFNTADVSYIMTNRLNQDVLENLFSYLRAMGATNDKPTALDIRYRLRRYILGKHSADFFTAGSNTSAVDDSISEVCLTSGIDEDFTTTDTHTKQPSDNESSFSNVAREDCNEESDEYKSDPRCGNNPHSK